MSAPDLTAAYDAAYGKILRRLVAQAFAAGGRPQNTNRATFPAISDRELRVSVIVSDDQGTHASGWWRNSEYDRCLHLSVVGMDARQTAYEDLPEADRRAIAAVVFGDDLTKTWTEPPATRLDPYRTAPA